MPKLSEHQSSKFTKLMYIGDSGTGKTGSLASLVAAGYKVRILDTDNGVDILKAFVKHECLDKIDNVDYETVRDLYEYVAGQGVNVRSGGTKAFVESLKLMDKWTDGTKPEQWGADTFFILDSLTGLGKQAFEFARGMNPASKDPRQWYFSAQQAIENTIAKLTSDDFQCNVILISHIAYKELESGQVKGYASSIGSALGPTIPKYFNSLILAERKGFGQNVKRVIRTVPTDLLDLKTAAPFAIPAELELSKGLAEIVKMLKDN